MRQKVVRVLVSQKGDAVQPNRRLTAACPALQEDGSRIRLGDRPKLFTADEGRDLGEAVVLGLFFPADGRFGSGSSPGPVCLPDEENSPLDNLPQLSPGGIDLALSGDGAGPFLPSDQFLIDFPCLVFIKEAGDRGFPPVDDQDLVFAVEERLAPEAVAPHPQLIVVDLKDGEVGLLDDAIILVESPGVLLPGRPDEFADFPLLPPAFGREFLLFQFLDFQAFFPPESVFGGEGGFYPPHYLPAAVLFLVNEFLKLLQSVTPPSRQGGLYGIGISKGSIVHSRKRCHRQPGESGQAAGP